MAATDSLLCPQELFLIKYELNQFNKTRHSYICSFGPAKRLDRMGWNFLWTLLGSRGLKLKKMQFRILKAFCLRAPPPFFPFFQSNNIPCRTMHKNLVWKWWIWKMVENCGIFQKLFSLSFLRNPKWIL